MFRKILLVLVVGAAFAASTTKIHKDLETSLKTNGSSNIFIKFQGGNRAAIKRTESLKIGNREKKVAQLAQNLKSLAEKSQKNALNLLEAQSATYKQFWASNEIYVKHATVQLVKSLELLPEVVEIRKEIIAKVGELSVESRSKGRQDPVEWNIAMIEVPAAWALPGGNNGANVVVGNIDTGVRSTHEALRENYRNSYGWFDSVENLEEPLDEFGSGTSAMGILVGQGGIGVAPGAQWIACRSCEIAGCTEEAIKACGQWMLCPTLPDGSQEDCSQSPRILANGWISIPGDQSFNDLIEAWKAADIIPIFAIGGQGPSCASTRAPADQAIVIGVGSTTENDTISERGGKGPSPQNAIKPDIVAPGDRVRSSWGGADDEYYVITGTSMSVSHIAGVAAMLLSTDPTLTYTQVKQILEDTAHRQFAPIGLECGGIPEDQFPNNVYVIHLTKIWCTVSDTGFGLLQGHGRLNARIALEAVIGNTTSYY